MENRRWFEPPLTCKQTFNYSSYSVTHVAPRICELSYSPVLDHYSMSNIIINLFYTSMKFEHHSLQLLAISFHLNVFLVLNLMSTIKFHKPDTFGCSSVRSGFLNALSVRHVSHRTFSPLVCFECINLYHGESSAKRQIRQKPIQRTTATTSASLRIGPEKSHEKLS